MANAFQKTLQRLAFGSDYVEAQKVEKDMGFYTLGGGSRGLIKSQPNSQEVGAPTPVNYQTLYRIYRQESWVRACVDTIRRSATALGWELSPVSKDANSESEQILKDFFEFPNPEDSFNDVLDDIFTDLNIYANAYVEIVLNEYGFPKELWNLDATTMKIKHDKHGYTTG